MRHVSSRIRLALLAAVAALAVFAAIAIGAQPKAGEYTDVIAKHPVYKSPIISIDFSVSGSPKKVRGLEYLDSYGSCGNKGIGTLTVQQALQVKENGSFRFTGRAKRATGGAANGEQVKVTGRFISKRRAKGTFKIPRCPDKNVSFDASKTGGGG